MSFYRGRGVGRFAFAFAVTAVLCLTTIGVVLWINGEWPSRVPPMWTQPSWQPWYPSVADSFWQGPYGQGIGWAYRIPVFIVYLAFVLATLFWPSPKNLAHVLALSAAHLIGIQFWYPEQGGIYVLWYLPFLLLLMFRPNLSTCQPPLLSSEDWLARLGRWLRGQWRKVLHLADRLTLAEAVFMRVRGQRLREKAVFLIPAKQFSHFPHLFRYLRHPPRGNLVVSQCLRGTDGLLWKEVQQTEITHPE